jgi:Protein of unknown function (DUF3631)
MVCEICRFTRHAEFFEIRWRGADNPLELATDNRECLRHAKPETIPGFLNRTRANWSMLLAIAELAGDETKRKAWAAARAIEQEKCSEDSSRSVQLLEDIRRVFDETGEVLMLSRVIAAKLAEDSTRPWAEYGRHRKPITPRELATLLGGIRYQLRRGAPRGRPAWQGL